MQNSDPFFLFEVKPDNAVGGTQKQRSTHKPRTLNPKWYEMHQLTLTTKLMCK